MKVLVVSGVFPPQPFAEANHAFHLCDNLVRRGHQVELLTSQGSVSDGLPFTVRAVMRDWSWRSVPRLLRYVKRSSPDAVLVVYIGFIYDDHPMMTFAPNLVRAALGKRRTVVQFENAMGAKPERSGTMSRVVRKALRIAVGSRDVDYEFGTLLRDSDGIITLSDRHEEVLATRYPAMTAKSVVLPAPPLMKVSRGDRAMLREKGRALLRVDAREPLLVYYGYIYPNKGVDTLLRAFAEMIAAGTRATLVLAGGIPAHLHDERVRYLTDLKRMAGELGIDEKVKWTGDCPWDSDDASLFLHAADVCVLPFDDGIRMNNSTFAAAAAHGCAVVATRGSVLEEVFDHGRNVFLCPPRDPAALASALRSVLGDDLLRQRLAEGSRLLGEESFSWDRTIERTTQLLARGA